ncbi:hypothetical protein I4U23_027164 [Adineta vaga]|nr:hypothetical protein I4U23_027164 [Adineta vaga]
MAAIGLSTLFCLLGLVTPGWGVDVRYNEIVGAFVFSPKTLITNAFAGVLTIMSLLLLIACITVLGLIFTHKLKHRYAPVGMVALLIVTTLFLLGTFSSFFSGAYTYSIKLMITAFTFTYLTSIIATYWLVIAYGDLSNIITKPASYQRDPDVNKNEPPEAF